MSVTCEKSMMKKVNVIKIKPDHADDELVMRRRITKMMLMMKILMIMIPMMIGLMIMSLMMILMVYVVLYDVMILIANMKVVMAGWIWAILISMLVTIWTIFTQKHIC